jgi:dephospho-CoA kinase
MKQIVAITGGIGSGKSVVSHILRTMGYPVYDCDANARTLMEQSAQIKQRIAAEVTPDAIAPDGTLCRSAISACVFTDAAKLATLNSIVHGAVRTHCAEWCKAQSRHNLIFVETAILYESGFDALVDCTWQVDAPTEVRIARVMKRNGITRSQVEQRIASQARTAATHPKPDHIISNAPGEPLLPQILNLIAHK